MAFSFFGGVHPKENKWYACDKETQVFPEPDIVVIPMSQHIGAPCNPLVKKGDPVTVGQKIGDNQGLCVPVHASVSGTVKAVEMRAHTSGTTVMSVVIENDHLDTLCEDIKPRTQEEVDALSPEELIGIIREGGIVGMGGATFPTHVKLSGGIGKVDTVIINAGECEPYITADDRLCREHPAELMKGLKIIMKIFGLTEGHIAIEDNKPDCIEKLTELVKDEPRIEVCPLQTKYPQGGERQLIYAVTGRAINSKMLPADAGCIVDNVETIIAVYRAVKLGRPVTNRISTITGDAIANPGNFLYSIGTSYAELVEAAGGFKTQPEKIISGGPMMGFAMFSLDIPTTKTSSSLLCLSRDEVSKVEPSACINCGRCVEACPEQLIPSRLAKFSNNGLAEAFESWHGLECVECGSCSFVCPARRQLAQSIKTMKKQVLAAKRKK